MLRHTFRPLVWTILLAISAGLTLTSCPTQPTNPPDPAILSQEYTTCTEVWLRVQIPDSTEHAGLRLYRSDSLISNFPVAPPDTVVIDTGLSPNTTYSYHTGRVQDNHEQSRSDPLSVTTLPTTSHQFTWTIDTLGNPQYGSSELNDVAIVDRDNIWAVGEINVDSGLYGAAVWDGMHWTLKQLTAGSSNVRPRGIWAFSSENIWFAAGSIYHWDGQQTTLEWSRNIQSTETVEKVWGTSPSNLYFVGNSGTIVHYDGATFTRLASGTELDIRDIWGATDPITGQLQILAVASNHDAYRPQGRAVLHIDPATETVSAVVDSGLPIGLSSLWFQPGQLYLVGGGGIFHKHAVENMTPWQQYPVTHYYTDGISGNGVNDLVISGAFLELLHFNGVTWRRYPDQIPNMVGAIRVTMRGNTAVAVGLLATGYAVAIRGQR